MIYFIFLVPTLFFVLLIALLMNQRKINRLHNEAISTLENETAEIEKKLFHTAYGRAANVDFSTPHLISSPENSLDIEVYKAKVDLYKQRVDSMSNYLFTEDPEIQRALNRFRKEIEDKIEFQMPDIPEPPTFKN